VIENIELYKSDKNKLKHLSIDRNTPLNEWMIKGAYMVLESDYDIPETPADDYATYTMDIPPELKQDIRKFVRQHEVKLRDFWVTVSKIILEKGGFE